MGRPEGRKEHANERPNERARARVKKENRQRVALTKGSSSIEDGRSFCAYARFSGVENYATAGSREREREREGMEERSQRGTKARR